MYFLYKDLVRTSQRTQISISTVNRWL